MKKQVDTLQKTAYTLTEIAQKGLIPWAKNLRTLRKLIAQGELKATVTGKGFHRRYVVRSADIKRYFDRKLYGRRTKRKAGSGRNTSKKA